MAESKLETLIERLEKAVSQLESCGTGAKPKSGSSGPSYVPLDDFNTLVSDFEQLGNKLDLEELHEMTSICLHAFDGMKKVMEYSCHGKGGAEEKKEISVALMSILKKFSAFQSNNKVNLHSKAIGEAINSVFWVVQETPDMALKGCIESSEFHALKFKSQKNQSHIKWYDSLIIALKNLKNYVAANYPTGLNWNVKGTADIKELVASLSNVQTSEKPAEKPAQAAPNKAALFEQLNQGDGVKTHLKKVTPDMKNKPVQDVPRRMSSKKEEKPPVPVKEEKKVEAVKPAKKVKKENWFVENFVDEKLIEFPEAECDIKESIFLDNCKNTCVVVNGKVKSIFISKCVKLNLIFKAVLSTVECINSKNIEIICSESSPTINIDKSESIHVCLPSNPNSSIVSAKTTALNITYKLPDGEYEKDTPIPEQLVTKWDSAKNKFVSQVLDLFI